MSHHDAALKLRKHPRVQILVHVLVCMCVFLLAYVGGPYLRCQVKMYGIYFNFRVRI